VLPDVGATIVPPGCSSPWRSASSIIAMAGRSFTLPPGLNSSTLATTSQARSDATRLRRTSGVLPTRSSNESAMRGAGAGSVTASTVVGLGNHGSSRYVETGMSTPHTILRTILSTILLAGVLATMTMSAGATARIPHPTGADEVVFHTESSPNSWGGEYPHATALTVLGDGRVVYGGGSELRVTERGLQRLLRDARRFGLLEDADYGQANVTDQGTTTVVVRTDAEHRVGVYALELAEVDRGVPRPQRDARRALRHFLHALARTSYWAGTIAPG
jgi:hypothetical protein